MDGGEKVNFPPILSGPILRRVDENQVNIWLATSENYDLSANLYIVEKKYELLLVSVKNQKLQLGQQLYVHLLTIFPLESSFPTDLLLGYNLLFSKGENNFDLQHLGYLDANSPSGIVYEQLKYPSFFISSNDKTSFLYGSCRKIHGKGEDCLSVGDQYLEKYQMDFSKRPSALFLVGDQIYADDVSELLFPFISKIANHLIGHEEDLMSVDNRVKNYKNRKQIAKYVCHFTSRKSEYHLFTFGEYAAMYLLSFSPILWKEILPELSKNISGNATDISHFAHRTYSIQRLLANIPTYMVFDDHDITDDWNITKKWKEKVENSPLGKHVLANGLTAYFAFQAWGNDPERFTSAFFLPLLEYTNNYSITSDIYKRWQHLILQFGPWSYVAPTKPKVVCLDTRTSREWSYGKNKLGKWITPSTSGPELINQRGWDFASKVLFDSGWNKGDRLVIVSPAPLYGIELIESYLQKYISPFQDKGLPVTTAFDLEAWRMNGMGVYHFYEELTKWDPSEVTVLSGDSHMASAVEVWTQFEKEKQFKLLQLTSSPLKNESFRGVTGLTLKTAIVLYSIFQTENKIIRFCDEKKEFHYHTLPITHTEKISEDIHYRFVNQKSMIELSNNLGIVSFLPGQISHHLIKSGTKKR
jgi:hypothetical protein